MAKLFQFIFGALAKHERAETRPTIETTLTRAQARKVVIGLIESTLIGEGFSIRKGGTFWRVNELKSDVIEIRFTTLEEVARSSIPESSFSIWAGSYFGFMSNISDKSSLHQIDDILTPMESLCQFRLSTQRGIEQSRKNAGDHLWCLTGIKTDDEVELIDALGQIEKTIIPALNEISTLDKWIDLLLSEISNVGFGQPGSYNRNFLLGCACAHAGNLTKALDFLKKAQLQSNEIIDRTSKAGVQFTGNSPIFMEQVHINNLIARLSN
jgi:hypothetical protein